MTDAYASNNVTSTTGTAPVNQTKEESKNNYIKEENCLPGSLTTNLNCSCNETNNTNALLNQKSNDNINVTSDINKKYEYNQSATNGIADLDTILKYVYKKNSKNNIPQKISGHSKNSLRRKKRFANINSTKPPLIVNYETSHAPQKEREILLPARNTANVIKHSDLADFNIETLHENNDGQQNKHSNKPPTIHENTNDSNEGADRENYKNQDEKLSVDSEESIERNDESSENYQNSNESEQSSKNNKKYSDLDENNRNENTSNHDEPHSFLEVDETDTNRSKEDSDSKEYYKSKYVKSHNRDDKSIENSSEEIEKNENIENKEPASEENSNFKHNDLEKYQFGAGYERSRSSPTKIQDVDLGEYERIKVNRNGEIVTANDAHENTDSDSATEVISTSKPHNGLKENDKISTLSKENTDSFSVVSHEHNEPTHINDGEVKPVVEINSDVDSTETSDENSSENLKTKLENESLETLTGVNEQDNADKSDKLRKEKGTPGQTDVKQEFERIPLNYNHAEKKSNKDFNVKHNEAKEENKDEVIEEGTLDKLKPRYDENLNIKFSNINIKLPDIKLPDDILSYAYENPPTYKDKDEQQDNPIFYPNPFNYEKNKEEQVDKPPLSQDVPLYKKYKKENEDKEKPRFYHYSDEVRDEPRDEVNQEDDDESDDDNNEYYGYNVDKKKKDAYKQDRNHDREYDDDLYEKFVRERFGKRGTFEKRLEKLTDYKSKNPHLYKKVRNILKKTEDVKTEADKSGDPNAGYMWTLEYGEKL